MTRAALTRAGEAVRRLLLAASVALTALALLGHGGIDVGSRLALATGASTTAAPGPSAAARPSAAGQRAVALAAGRSASAGGAESQPPASSSALRTARAAALAGGSPLDVAPPGSAPHVAPHLVARPVARPPSVAHALDLRRGAASRAPPGAAGT